MSRKIVVFGLSAVSMAGPLLTAPAAVAKEAFSMEVATTNNSANLTLKVTASPVDGYLREASDYYDDGNTYKFPALSCGINEKHFEVWSRRNINAPGSMTVTGHFKLHGSNKSASKSITRSFKTLIHKGKAHWKKSDFRLVITVVCKGGSGWLGFANSQNKDRDSELKKNCGDFERITVPSGSSFDSLCGSIGKRCVQVCDWEGNGKSCGDSPYSWGDGSRVAKCR